MAEEQIVTPAWIAAVRQNYGLDTRTAFEAGQVWGEHGVMAGAVTALGHALDRVEQLEKEKAALTKGIHAVANLINDSHGVVGLHLNGDIAPWEDLRTGGGFEEWLLDFDAALDTARTPTTETDHG